MAAEAAIATDDVRGIVMGTAGTTTSRRIAIEENVVAARVEREAAAVVDGPRVTGSAAEVVANAVGAVENGAAVLEGAARAPKRNPVGAVEVYVRIQLAGAPRQKQGRRPETRVGVATTSKILAGMTQAEGARNPSGIATSLRPQIFPTGCRIWLRSLQNHRQEWIPTTTR